MCWGAVGLGAEQQVGALVYEPPPRRSCRLGCFCGFVELWTTVSHFSRGGGGEAVRVMSLLGQSVNRHEKVAVDMASASDGETCCLGASQPAGAGVWGAGSPHAVVGWTTRLSLQSWAGQGSL